MQVQNSEMCRSMLLGKSGSDELPVLCITLAGEPPVQSPSVNVENSWFLLFISWFIWLLAHLSITSLGSKLRENHLKSIIIQVQTHQDRKMGFFCSVP